MSQESEPPTGGRERADETTDPESATSDRAERIVLSHPADLSDWGRDQLEMSSFRTYLGKVHDEARVGDVWEEFVDVGCCGSAMDVPLRVERVDGGSRPDRDTKIEYETRDSCEMEGSWQVQSEGGPKSA
ncbi:hypothetical protein [Halopiger aswanensis]|uniref:DUF7968 domain-containing protein n=1 Tax=Halopiger aswanensis TaxID=148449 RepID=A0A3R7HJ71_9EURY|nr:hypothetical protein [Halopiger aswanensis]RKD95747.1 hypothetical protein ATJ93_2609 [Halopiger aswanensis]